MKKSLMSSATCWFTMTTKDGSWKLRGTSTCKSTCSCYLSFITAIRLEEFLLINNIIKTTETTWNVPSSTDLTYSDCLHPVFLLSALTKSYISLYPRVWVPRIIVFFELYLHLPLQRFWRISLFGWEEFGLSLVLSTKHQKLCGGK